MNLASATLVLWTDREDTASKSRHWPPWTSRSINPRRSDDAYTLLSMQVSQFLLPRRVLERTMMQSPAGIIHVCFERSPLPSLAGKRYLALRLVKIAEPIRLRPDDQKRPIPPLREGDLIKRATNKLWTIDCESSSKMRIAFGRLFDDQMPDGGEAAKQVQS